jgi:selenocysteine lyase/cysteine desulfurase
VRRIYLDNAATSFPKPPGVWEAVKDYGERLGATPGRAGYAESLEGGRVIRRCRERLVRLVNAPSPDHAVFTLNTTDALNLAVKGRVSNARRRDPARPLHLVTTAFDHNSVLRPFNELASCGVRVTFVDGDPASGRVDPAAIRHAITPQTILVALNHVSNVTGVIQDAAAVGRVCRDVGVAYLLDAAQSAGHTPVDMRAWSVDLLALPGHKGLLGPLGTGALVMRPGMEERIDTLREGGTGTASESDTQPGFMPDKYEPGSHNAPGIAGLAEALRFILDRTPAALRRHEESLIARMLDGLRRGGAAVGAAGPDRSGPLAGLSLLGPDRVEDRTGIFSLTHATLSPAELALTLETEFGVLARPGVHCAPRAHRALGTSTGALRLSLGPFISADDVRHTLDALAAVCRSARAHSLAAIAPTSSAMLTQP